MQCNATLFIVTLEREEKRREESQSDATDLTCFGILLTPRKSPAHEDRIDVFQSVTSYQLLAADRVVRYGILNNS